MWHCRVKVDLAPEEANGHAATAASHPPQHTALAVNCPQRGNLFNSLPLAEEIAEAFADGHPPQVTTAFLCTALPVQEFESNLKRRSSSSMARCARPGQAPAQESLGHEYCKGMSLMGLIG